jgi:hypothetical protein
VHYLQELAFVGDATPQKDFESPQKWKSADLTDYAKKTIAKKAGFSVALWAITLALFLIFILW